MGNRKELIMGINAIMLGLYQKINKDVWSRLRDHDKNGLLLLRINTKEIERIEHGIYDEKKLYIWYIEKSDEMERIDLEMGNESEAKRVLKKIQNIVKNEKTKIDDSVRMQ